MPALRALWKGADPDIPSSSTLAGRAGQNSSGSLGTRCGDVWAHRSRGKFACCSRRSSGFRPTHRRMNQAPSNVEPSAERISFLPLHFSVCHRSVSFSNSLFEPLQIEADWDEKYGPLRAGFPLTLSVLDQRKVEGDARNRHGSLIRASKRGLPRKESKSGSFAAHPRYHWLRPVAFCKEVKACSVCPRMA
jgi:hypothetical protein